MPRLKQQHDLGVAAFLRLLSPEVRPVVVDLRQLVRAAAPEATETAVWGALSYHLAFLGGRVKGAVCQICARGRRVELGFVHGALLPDPKGLLQGSGKSKRVVRVDEMRRLDRPRLVALVRHAVEIRPDTAVASREERGRLGRWPCSKSR